MPKIKIGEKILAGDSSKEVRRDFNNGHKFFTTTEACILRETQQREKRATDNFDNRKYTYMKPRNPIMGEATPRNTVNTKGEFVVQPGELLFRPPSARVQTARNEAPSASNSQTPRTDRTHYADAYSPNGNNPLKRSDMTEERIFSLQNAQDNISGELEYLKAKLVEKQRILNSMR